MNLYSLLSSWAVLIYLFLGFYVFINSPRTRLNLLFLCWTICMAEYSLCFTFLYASANNSSFQFWYKLSVLGWAAHMSLVLHIIYLLTHRRNSLNIKWLPAVYAPGGLVLFYRLFLNDYLAHRARWAFPVYFCCEDLYIYGFAVICLYLLWRWGKNSPMQQERKQAKVLVLSGSVTAFLSLLNDLPLPGFNPVHLPPMGHLILLILAIGLIYASAEYHFLRLNPLLKVKDLVDNVGDLIFIVDNQGKIVDYNLRVIDKLAYAPKELLGHTIETILQGKGMELVSLFLHNELSEFETSCLAKNGQSLPVIVKTSVLKKNNRIPAGYIFFCQDRTVMTNLQAEMNTRLRREAQITYLNTHDHSTGLFNRLHFEEKLKTFDGQTPLSAGVLICDIDGLKLVNDTFGHQIGDQLLVASAHAIQNAFGQQDTVARIGGDEFAVLAPGGTLAKLRKACQDIQTSVARFNQEHPQAHLSLSMGYAFADAESKKMIDLFKDADNYMNKQKLNHSQSVRNAIIQAVLKTLEARDMITENHTQRIFVTLTELGESLNLPESTIANLKLLGQFHDIGKVGIPDQILFKPGPLTPLEMKEMQRHSEIGHRIALSIPDLQPIADLILKHHERWDGTGYPLGLREDAIPLECRILAVADAFDAMTNNRPYRQAMSPADAEIELRKNAGAQFDPLVVGSFLELLRHPSSIKNPPALRISTADLLTDLS